VATVRPPGKASGISLRRARDSEHERAPPNRSGPCRKVRLSFYGAG